MDPARIEAAEQFLQEAVYASRGTQAARTNLAAGASSSPSGCGLGARAEVALELTPRGAELFRAIWPSDPSPSEVGHVRACMTAWIRRQDALDRERNHFIKAFRKEHGPDRSTYSPELDRAYTQGLAEINASVNSELKAAAHDLLAQSRP